MSLGSTALLLLREIAGYLFRVPQPDPVLVLFHDQGGLMTTYPATILMPALRDDEKAFKTPSGAAIDRRRVTIKVGDADPTTQDVPLDQPQIGVTHVPAGAALAVGWANVTTDGLVSDYTTRTVTAPAEPVVVPTPDAGSITFGDAEPQ